MKTNNKSKFFILTFLSVTIILSLFSASAAQLPVNLGTAGDFVILSKAGISNVPGSTTSVIGDMGVSPIDSTSITGFDLIGVIATDTFLTSALVTGQIYSSDLIPPTPAKLTTAISDMETAYTDAAGRTELLDPTMFFLNAGDGAGEIGGLTLTPGLYTFTTAVTISTDITLNGNSSDVWIFQIPGTLDIASGADVPTGIKVLLSGGAQAKNVFWQVADTVTLGTYSTFNGNILTAEPKPIVIQTSAILSGRALSQEAVTLDANVVTMPTTTYYEYDIVTNTCSLVQLISPGPNDYAILPDCESQITSPPAEDTSSSSHGGSGGICVTKWTCTEWATCADGTQTRICSYPTNFCTPRLDKPVTSQSCIVTPISGTNPPIDAIDNNPSPSITGGVIGNIKGILPIWLWIVIGTAIIGIAVLLSVAAIAKSHRK